MHAIADNNHVYMLQFTESDSSLKTLKTLHTKYIMCLVENKNQLLSLLEQELNLYFQENLLILLFLIK